ncbi:MAG TPA: VWA domain-containing protein [Candidatus Limnocylindrales bacterium]|nr:VWA domain-containing protein [Candidatus Limnocylindrales bacterium]
MSFLAPQLLLGLLLIPVAIGFYLWAQRRRSRYAVRFTNLALLSNLAPRRPSWRRHLPPVLYLGAIAALLIGLARPTMVLQVPREDATVILTMDVSGSMRATDVSPTRLDAAKASALSFIDQLPDNVRVGVVAFASEPVTLVSPTTDRAQLKEAINGLAARDGTAMGDALMQVLDIAEKIQKDNASETPDASAAPGASTAPDPSVAPGSSSAPTTGNDKPADKPLVAAILLSDGANSVGQAQPLDAAQRAKTLGVPIYTIALGTPDGTVQVQDDFGQTVTLDVPPDTETLQQIASITGGQAFDAPTAAQLASVYDNLQSRIGYTEQRQEVTFALVGAGLLLVVLGAGLSAVWFGRLP